MVQWIFFVGPYLKTSLHPFARGVEMAYPTMDLLMFVALAPLALGTGVRTWAYRLLVVAVGLWIVGDELFGLSVDNYTAGGWLDAFWLASYVCWGAAGLEPVENWRLALDRRQVPRLTKGRIALLAAALLTVPAVILVEHFWHGHNLHSVSIAVGASLLAVLVIARFAGLVRAVDSARIAEREANQRLRELDRLKDEFVSTISHELRTPLTSITGYVELAREQADPETNGYLAVVERNAARLLSLVNDLLFVARLQSGGLDLEEEPVDVAQLVAESVAAAKPQAVGANVELRLRLTGCDTAVRGDRRRLAQVIDNLVSNAIKFSPDAGSVDLTVGRGNGKVTIEVEDRGIGLSESERERLFERFFRSQGALDRQIPGTGLGLYITKSIVEAHGGSVAARSAVGEGSSFVVELPAAS
jgi:signal transduction histidine kinase